VRQLWLPGATKINGPHSQGGTMAGGEGLCTHHITVTPTGSYGATREFLLKMGYEPTLILDPTTGERGQFLPANRSAYALEHPSGQPETNRQGSVHVQIEWLWPSMAKDITKAPKFAELWADLIPWLEQLGVPSLWTFGSPLNASRDPKLWVKGGHRGHRNAPANSHDDSLPCKTPPPWHQLKPKPKAQPLGPATRLLARSLTKRLKGRARPVSVPNELDALDTQIHRVKGLK